MLQIHKNLKCLTKTPKFLRRKANTSSETLLAGHFKERAMIYQALRQCGYNHLQKQCLHLHILFCDFISSSPHVYYVLFFIADHVRLKALAGLASF